MYFARPRSDALLKTVDSPVLRRAGAKNEFEAGGHAIPNMGDFTKIKQSWNAQKGRSYLETEGEVILPGFTGKKFD